MKKSRVIICGRGASGKDHLKNAARKDPAFVCSVSHTTRPPRNNEIDGLDYHFVDFDTSEHFNHHGFWKESVIFNEWFYGTSETVFENSNFFIMTPSGINQLEQEDRDTSLVIYIDVSEEIRRERMLIRRDADSVERRLVADEKDFKDFKNFDIKIINSEFKCEDILNFIKLTDIII